jgi:hypothetical protein
VDVKHIAIPLHGKMVYRSLHTLHLARVFHDTGLKPVYYVGKDLLPANNESYAELYLEAYQHLLKHPYMQFSNYLRWFMVQTQSTETRLRNMISDSAWTTENLNNTLLKALGVNILRNAKYLAPILIWGEEQLGNPKEHTKSFDANHIRGVLVSGIGNHDFEIGNLFAREARQQKLPVFANITNYDNLLSKGYRGFTPDRLAVWSKKMAGQAQKLMGIKKDKLMITGPTVFDRYFQPVGKSREEFLLERGLDPNKKTLFYAGHTSVITYFDFLTILIRLSQPGGLLTGCNIIIRPYPHPKVSQCAGIHFFRERVAALPNVYISDPYQTSTDTFVNIIGESTDTSADELHGILKYSDVMVNYFSTLGLEAAICDLPTIHIGYDPFTYQISPMAWASTGARNAHNQDPLRRSASRVVTSDNDLIEALESYLKNHDLHQEERNAYALSECEFLDGKATSRLAEMIQEYITK